MFLRSLALLLLSTTLANAQDVRLVADNARGVLNAASLLRALDEDADPQDYVAAARADYRRLLTALYAEGYYSGTISITIDGVEAANIAPLATLNTIGEVIIAVDAGPRFTFGRVAIAPLPPGTTVSEDLGPRRTAESDVIKRAVSASINSWRDLGYAKARVASQQITARHNDNKLDIAVALAPGPQLRFGPLRISGNEDVRTDRIREIAGLPVGEVYAPSDVAKAEQRLRRIGTFDSVSLSEADNVGADGTLAIDAKLDESKPRRIGFGIELSTIEGLTLSSFWLHRNLLGGAERLRVDGEVASIGGETGGIDYALRGNFTRPATFGADTEFFIKGVVSRDDEPDYLLDKVAVETGFTRILTEDLTVSAGVGILSAREVTEAETREYVLLTLPLEATLDRRDVPTNAKSGYYLDAKLTPFLGLRGDLDGARFFGDGRAYYSFGEDQKLTFAARGQLGSIANAGSDRAPADFLFYSGGGGTVRGQPYNALGIDTVSGGETITTGGTSFAGLQLEARYQVREKISVVGFYDFGAVGDTAVPLETGDWHAGAGIGLRYETGIGPIRLDLGTQASGEDAGQSLQVYIGIGQAF